MKKYSIPLFCAVSIILISLTGCEKKTEESGNPKISVSVGGSRDYEGFRAFIAVFTGDDDISFHAAGNIMLEPMQLNSVELLEVDGITLGTQIAHLAPGDYYIGAYIDMNSSTTNLSDLSTWLPDPGDYEMEVRSITITEDVTLHYNEFKKVAGPGMLSVRMYNAAVLQGNPVHYIIVKKDEDSQVLSAGTITWPLADNIFTAMEVDQSQEKVFDGGEYKLQIYCDLDNSQSGYIIGEPFHANFGDILIEHFFYIDGDTIVYDNSDFFYNRIGYAVAKIKLCGLDGYNGATSYFTLYKKDAGNSEIIYGTANAMNLYSIDFEECYTYNFSSYEPNSSFGYFVEGSDYFIKGIVDIDSSSIVESRLIN